MSTDSTFHTCIEKNCGREFEITASNRQFFEDKGYPLPKRCQPCRQKRKAAKEGNNPGMIHPAGNGHEGSW